MPKLIILKDGKEARSFTLEADSIRIGSAQGNTIRIKSDDISREHCEIRRNGMQFRLVDLESKNGTKVNGTFVNQHVLEEGDRIELGSIVLEFRRNGVSNGPGRAAPTTRPARARATGRGSAASRRSRAGARRGPPPPGRHAPSRPPSSAMPLVMLCAAMGLVLVIVVAVVVSGGDEDRVLTRNESLLREMRRLEDTGQATSAIALAAQADRSGDPGVLRRIDDLASRLSGQLMGSGGDRIEARKDIERLLVEASKARSDQAASVLAEIDAALARYQGVAEPYYLGQLRTMRAKVAAGNVGASGAAGGSLQARFEAMEKEAFALQDRKKYGEAIALWETFFERNKDLVTSTVARKTFEPKVEKKQKTIREVVLSRWEKIVDRAAWLVGQGHPDRAIKLYEQQAGVWGISKYEKMAESEIRKIRLSE